MPFPSSEDLPDPGIKPTSPAFELIKPLILKHLQDLPSSVPVCSGQSLILTLSMWNWCQPQPLSSRCHALGIYVLWIERAFGKEKLLVSCLGCDGNIAHYVKHCLANAWRTLVIKWFLLTVWKLVNTVNLWDGELPGGPVVRTLGSHCWSQGSVPGQGTKIPQAAWCSQTTFFKSLRNWT